MARSSLRMNVEEFCVLGFLSILLLIQKGDAYQFKVGGPRGSWTVPSDPNAASYNQWAEMNRFQIGDTLLFVYPADKDSVLHVIKDDYTNCNTASPLEKFTDGHTEFKFNQSGPYYFISGVKEHCQKNEKLVVVVMADRGNKGSNQPTPSSPPSPSAVPPPSPAPAGEESPSPPPSVEPNPTPAPAHESPKKNAASLIVTSVVGSIGVVAASYLMLVF